LGRPTYGPLNLSLMVTMRLYMETTKIAPSKTAAEIGEILSYAGATKIMTEYNDKQIVALTFALIVKAREVPFSLPIRVDPVFRILNGRHRVSLRTKHSDADRDQAVRVAWRQLLRWVQAQLALVDTGMVENLEVFLPYVKMNNGETFYKSIETSGFKMLPYNEIHDE